MLFRSHRLNNEYAAKMELILKNDQISDVTGSMYSAYYAAYADVNNQTRLLKSYDLLETVIGKLDFNVSYFIEGRLKTTEVYGDTPFKVEVINISSWLYNQSFNLKILSEKEYQLSYLKENELVTNIHQFGEKALGGDYFFNVTINDFLTKKQLETLKLIDYQFKVHSTAFLIGKYQKAIAIKNLEYSSILEVTCSEMVPTKIGRAHV